MNKSRLVRLILEFFLCEFMEHNPVEKKQRQLIERSSIRSHDVIQTESKDMDGLEGMNDLVENHSSDFVLMKFKEVVECVDQERCFS